MSKTTITITDATPNPNNVSVAKGGHVVFANSDDEAYSIDFVPATQDCKVSNDSLPLMVPATGKVELHIKNDAPAQAFNYEIKDSDGEVVWPIKSGGPGNKPPEVIVI